MKKNWPVLVGLIVLAFFLLDAAQLLSVGFMRQLDAMIYDAKLRLFLEKTVDPRLVIVDIDEKSLIREGRWPWGRDRMGALLDHLFDRDHVALVGFDVVFAQPDESSGLSVLDQLSHAQLRHDPSFQEVYRRIRPALDHDQRFIDRLRDRPVVLSYYFTNENQRTSGALPAPVLLQKNLETHRIPFVTASGFGANLASFQQVASNSGFFNPLPDPDGSIRRVQLLEAYQGGLYESFALAVVRTLTGGQPLEFSYQSYSGNQGALESLRTAGMEIPVDQHVAALVPYRGPQGSYPYVSATDVLHDQVDPKQLDGAIVLVGTTAFGLKDLRVTPVGETYPGVEVHANLITGILDQTIKQEPWFVQGANLLLLTLTGLLLAPLLPRLEAVRSTLLSAALLVLLTGLNLYLWKYKNIQMPVAGNLLLVSILYGWSMIHGYFQEARTKRQLAGLFGQYVPPDLVSVMSKDPERFTMEGESRELTILFSDVRGFTTLSEGLEARALAKLMNLYLTAMTETIYQHQGTIDKYIGDAIMAFWGAPVSDVEHARHALETALSMQQRLTDLNRAFQEYGWPAIQIGVGLNAGLVSVGNMGSSYRIAYTVMGDAVNLASRLESLTKQYGVGILVGESVAAPLSDHLFLELDRVRVKGKDQPVAIYQPLGLRAQATPTALQQRDLFLQALHDYRTQSWDNATSRFAEWQEQSHNKKLGQLYLDRIAQFRRAPPPDPWDGVFTFQEK